MSVDFNITDKLADLHSKLKLNYGNFSEEYPEQEMAAMYIKPDDIVLELGGNIGRNSCIIASLLNDSKHLVVFESDVTVAQYLKENRDLNNLNFHIEDCAISKCDLYQNGINTVPVNYIINHPHFVNWTKIKNCNLDSRKPHFFSSTDHQKSQHEAPKTLWGCIKHKVI